jgi:hypothetical protein
VHPRPEPSQRQQRGNCLVLSVHGRAVDAGACGGQGSQAARVNAPPATRTRPMIALAHPFGGLLQLTGAKACVVEEGADAGSLKADGGALRVVLIIGWRVNGASYQGGQFVGQVQRQALGR